MSPVDGKGSIVPVIRTEQVLAVAACVIPVLFAFWVFARHSHLVAAWSGFSPEEFVLAVNDPGVMAGDYSSGATLYRSSSFMWLYILAERYLDWSPGSFRWGVVLLEVVLGALTGLLLARTLVRDAKPVAVVAIVLVVALSDAREPDLGRWGAPIYLGLYYTVADFLRVAGILLVLQGRLLAAAVLLGLAFTVHPTMGVMGGVFAAAAALATWRRIPIVRAVVAVAVFGAVAGIWALQFIGLKNVGAGGVDPETWVVFTRMMNFHFFPWEYGIFGRAHAERLFPLLACLGLALAYWASPPPEVRFQFIRPILAGMLAAGVLVVLGVLFSVFLPEPLFVKLALQRTSDLILMFAAPVAAAGLAFDVQHGRPGRAVVAALLLGLAFIVWRGLPLGLAALLFVPIAMFHRPDDGDRAAHYSLRVMIALLVPTVIYFAASGMLTGWKTPTYFGVQSIQKAPLISIAALALLVLVPIATRVRFFSMIPGRSLAALALIVLALSWSWSHRPLARSGMSEKAASYQDVQRWARAHTPPGTLFMPDPTHYYGWRAYSHRPSFGNLREWLMTGWFYASDKAAFDQGMERVAEFGVELKTYLDRMPPLRGYFELHGKIRKIYYSQPKEWFERMAARHGVRHFMFHKDRVPGAVPLPVLYENEHFILGSLPP